MTGSASNSSFATALPENPEQDDEPGDLGSSSRPREPGHARRQNSGLDPNSPWAKQNVLTFDGGGIRGYYSLLHLRALMDHIRTAEEEMDEAERVIHESGPGSSFAPCGEPRNVSHRPSPGYTRYLPCHYFDYIGGTSTGALSTIMLARLRMPVEDCLDEYRRMAGQIFGFPRIIHQASKIGAMRVTKKNKYSTTRLELAIKDVIRRRGEVATDQDDAMLFSTPKGCCRAIVIADRAAASPDGAVTDALAVPYIFRSYDNFHKNQVHGRDHESKKILRPRNPGQGTRFAAWKVARAATAAPLFFKPLEIALDDGEVVQRRTNFSRISTARSGLTTNMSRGGLDPTTASRPRETVRITDGGFGPNNNPSKEVFEEIKSIFKDRHKSIDTWVSIGTARASATAPEPHTQGVILSAIGNHGDPEPVHDFMATRSQEETREFDYFRFNEPNGLRDVQMDDWFPRKSNNNSGTKTLQNMETVFNTWAARAENVDRFQKCAKKLVKTRRARAKESPSLWSRFALGTFYVCPTRDCQYDPDETWHYKSTFLQHMEQEHRRQPSQMEERNGKPLRDCEYSWEYKNPQRSF